MHGIYEQLLKIKEEISSLEVENENILDLITTFEDDKIYYEFENTINFEDIPIMMVTGAAPFLSVVCAIFQYIKAPGIVPYSEIPIEGKVYSFTGCICMSIFFIFYLSEYCKKQKVRKENNYPDTIQRLNNRIQELKSFYSENLAQIESLENLKQDYKSTLVDAYFDAYIEKMVEDEFYYSSYYRTQTPVQKTIQMSQEGR